MSPGETDGYTGILWMCWEALKVAVYGSHWQIPSQEIWGIKREVFSLALLPSMSGARRAPGEDTVQVHKTTDHLSGIMALAIQAALLSLLLCLTPFSHLKSRFRTVFCQI